MSERIKNWVCNNMALVSFTEESVLALWSQHRSDFATGAKHDETCRGPGSIWSCQLCSSISWLFRNKERVIIDGEEYVQTTHKGAHKANIYQNTLTVDPVTCHALISWYLLPICPRGIPKILVNTWCKATHRIAQPHGLTLAELAKKHKGLSAETLGGIIKQLLVYLHQLQKFSFRQHCPSMDDLMFYTEPVAFRYRGRKVLASVLVKFADLSHSSITLENGVVVSPDFPIPIADSDPNLTQPSTKSHLLPPISGYWQHLCSLGLRDLIEEDQWLSNVDKIIYEKEQDPQLLDLLIETMPKEENTISKIN
jgi:hypothetical protein